jgi:hypothetical protein
MAVLSIIVSMIPFQAYGDGFSQENVYANIGDRKMAMFIKVNPPILTSENLQDRYLQLRFFDAETNKPVNNVTFFLNVTKGNEHLMYETFYTNNGSMVLRFQPGGTVGQWTVYGNQQGANAAWYSETNEVDVQAPILSDGGLYHFNMELLGFDYPNEFVTPYSAKVKFDSYLSVGDISNQGVNYNSKSYNTTIVSYFDKTSNFNFNQSKLQFSWSMPFDWNPSRYQDRPFLVHEELRVPNSLKEFVGYPAFSATVNGYPMNPDKILLDTFSIANTTIVHLFVNKDDMQRLSETIGSDASTMDFAVSPSKVNVTTSTDIFTDFGGWQIKLGWSPQSLNGGTTNNLKLMFYDQLTGQPIGSDVSYDLQILDRNGGKIISKSNLIAQGGIDIQSLDMPSDGIYVMKVSVNSVINNGITDTSRIGTARGNIVIPSIAGQETIPEFPFAMPILVFGIASLIIFYRMKIKSKFYE